VLAAEHDLIQEVSDIIAFESEEFPDAYIITEVLEATVNPLTGVIDLGRASATVFVEETWAQVGSEIIVTESRLLSEEEVLAIGLDNFLNLEDQKFEQNTLNSDSTATRGKLTIEISGSYLPSGNGVKCNVEGVAEWELGLFYNSETMPAIGTDFFGIVYSGGYTQSGSCTATSSSGLLDPPVTRAEITPNAGTVWEFNETIGDIDYVSKAEIDMTLTKNTLTGGGNTAEVVLKYIHTYQTHSGSINISATPTSVGVGFSLNNVNKQWSIAAMLTNIPY